MVEGKFGSDILKEYAPVGIILNEMESFSEAHQEAVVGNPKTVKVDGHEVVIKDEGAGRTVTQKK